MYSFYNYLNKRIILRDTAEAEKIYDGWNEYLRTTGSLSPFMSGQPKNKSFSQNKVMLGPLLRYKKYGITKLSACTLVHKILEL